MKEVELFENFTEDASTVIHQLLECSPIGVMILNNQLKLININACLKDYFQQKLHLEEKRFGNIFGCQYAMSENEMCGTKTQCDNCKLRNSMRSALTYNRVIKNLQLRKVFLIDNQKKIMWFDMTMVPITIKGESFLWVYLIDLTEHMKYKIESQMNEILSDEEKEIN